MAHDYLISGERLALRQVTLDDVTDAYERWMNDPETVRYLESRFRPQPRQALIDYVRGLQGDPNNLFLAITLKEDGRHIGNIKLGPINWIHRHGDIGLVIGEKDCWGKGYATEAIRLIAGFAFWTLNLHKLTAGCYDGNIGSIRAFQRAGFEIEGTRREQYFSEGRYVDGVLLGQVRPAAMP